MGKGGKDRRGWGRGGKDRRERRGKWENKGQKME